MKIVPWYIRQQLQFRSHINACERVMVSDTFDARQKEYAERSRKRAFNHLIASQLEHISRD